MRINISKRTAAVFAVAVLATVMLFAMIVIAAEVSIPAELGWNENISTNNSTFGIVEDNNTTAGNLLLDNQTQDLGLTPFINVQNVLPWPVVKSVSPNPVSSGKNVTFTVKFEYPFPGTTANVADTLPSGFTGAANFKLDGKSITPTIQSGNLVEFDNVPSPSASSPTGVRTITFTAKAPTVSSTSIRTDTATAQFFANGFPYGPKFFFQVGVTITP